MGEVSDSYGIRNIAVPAGVPKSTRIGLIDLLHEMDSPAATQLLAATLSPSQTVEEMIYLSKMLVAMDQKTFRPPAITVTRSLLTTASNPTEETLLLHHLAWLGDKELARNLNPADFFQDGRLRYSLLMLVTESLQAEAIPILAQAIEYPNIRNRDRSLLMSVAMEYVGKEVTANEMFQNMFAAETTTPKQRGIMLTELAGYQLGSGLETLSPSVAQARLTLLESVSAEDLSNPVLEPIVKAAKDQLEHSLNPNDYTTAPSFDFQEFRMNMDTTKVTLSNGQEVQLGVID